MKEDMHDMLEDFYGYDDIPGYIQDAGKTFITLRAGDEIFGDRKVKITMEDVVDYYLTQAANITSGCRSLAGLTGDWRPIDMMARECLGWFRHVNIEGMRRAARKQGLVPRF